MENALISVIVPVYNTGKYLTNCVKSILEQTYKNIEILLVDDGSDDNTTLTICNELELTYSKVRVIHQDNMGAAAARNRGIEEAKGNYLCFIDSDDFVESEMIENLLNHILKHKINISFCDLGIDNSKPIIRAEELPKDGIYTKSEVLHFFMLGYWHSMCTGLYHKDILKNYKFPVGETNEDYILKFHLIMNEDSIYIDRRKYYHYIKRDNSVTTTSCSVRNLDWIKHTKEVLSIIQSEETCSDLLEEAKYQLLYSCIVLCNKAILGISANREESKRVYREAAICLKRYEKELKKNKFLSSKYRMMGLCISIAPTIYRIIISKVIAIKRIIK